MSWLSAFVLVTAATWAAVLVVMFTEHRRKMRRIKAVEDKLDQGSAEAETRRKVRPTPLRDIPPGSKIETQHDYVNDCLLVTVTLPDGTKEHHAIWPDNTDSLLDLKRRERFLMRDALARQQGLNVDGTFRRETVSKVDAVGAARRQAERQLGTMDAAFDRRRDREERRRRDEADYAPSIVLPSVYDRPEPALRAEDYPLQNAHVDRPDDGMRGGGFTTGGSFGGEGFSSGSDSSSSNPGSGSID